MRFQELRKMTKDPAIRALTSIRGSEVAELLETLDRCADLRERLRRTPGLVDSAAVADGLEQALGGVT